MVRIANSLRLPATAHARSYTPGKENSFIQFMQKLIKKFFLFIRNPLTGFIFYFICVSIFLLIPPGKEGTISFVLLLPFILFAIVGLNLSFFSTLFGRFTISEAKKRNHALEHGTIHFLKKFHGKKLRVGGRAENGGFRICGVKKKQDLSKAFEQFIREMRNPNPDLFISLRCSSNIVTAQGFGLIILTISALFLKILHANYGIIVLVLAANLLFYFLLRRKLGGLIQEKLFMSLNFSSARIHSINKVKKEIFGEINPVYFVKTIVE